MLHLFASHFFRISISIELIKKLIFFGTHVNIAKCIHFQPSIIFAGKSGASYRTPL